MQNLQYNDLEYLRNARTVKPSQIAKALQAHKKYCIACQEKWEIQTEILAQGSAGAHNQILPNMKNFVKPIFYVHLIEMIESPLSGHHQLRISKSLTMSKPLQRVSDQSGIVVVLENCNGRKFEYLRDDIYFKDRECNMWGKSLFIAGDWFVDDFVDSLMALSPGVAYETYSQTIFGKS